MVSTDEIRAAFPALERRHEGFPVAYFDGPGGTQVPRAVGGPSRREPAGDRPGSRLRRAALRSHTFHRRKHCGQGRGVGQARDGLVRLRCACYTSEDEVDRVVESLRAIARSHD